jgi:hypothetical protein
MISFLFGGLVMFTICAYVEYKNVGQLKAVAEIVLSKF